MMNAFCHIAQLENCDTLVRNRARLERQQAPWESHHFAASASLSAPREDGMSARSNEFPF